MDTVIEILNMPIVITLLGGLLLMVLDKLHAAKPKWARFEGAILAAIKRAEKHIPNDTPNKSLARLNSALQYVVEVYEVRHGKAPTAAMRVQFQEGIQITHSKLEEKGGNRL